MFVNIQHLFEVYEDVRFHEETKLVPPLILWHLWKNCNLLLFGSKFYLTDMLIKKVLDDALSWSEVNPKGDTINTQENGREDIWQPPYPGSLKCNLDYTWSSRDNISGASWVFRDHCGSVLMHSRCSFSGIHSKCEAATRSWMWALKSMHSMK